MTNKNTKTAFNLMWTFRRIMSVLVLIGCKITFTESSLITRTFWASIKLSYMKNILKKNFENTGDSAIVQNFGLTKNTAL